MYSKTVTGKSTKSSLAELRSALDQAEAVFIGAGAGLSASAGFAYSGPRFRQYFSDFEEKYGFHDMYTGGFTRFASPEEQWAYWSRMIFLNRYCPPPKPVYQNLRKLVGDKDYFVLTTNVDHCFQKAGFDKARLFYTQGDYGLWQCSRPCHQKTYDNETAVRQMLEAQGFSIQEDGGLATAPGNGSQEDRSHRAGAPLPQVRRAHEHEPAAVTPPLWRTMAGTPPLPGTRASRNGMERAPSSTWSWGWG